MLHLVKCDMKLINLVSLFHSFILSLIIILHDVGILVAKHLHLNYDFKTNHLIH